MHAAGDGSYRTLIDPTRRRVMGQEAEPLETVVGRAVREELQRNGGATPRR